MVETVEVMVIRLSLLLFSYTKLFLLELRLIVKKGKELLGFKNSYIAVFGGKLRCHLILSVHQVEAERSPSAQVVVTLDIYPGR